MRSVISFYRKFNILKGFTTIQEGSNDLKLFSTEVCFYQACKCFILGETARQQRTKNDRFKTPKNYRFKTIVFALYFL